MPLYRGFTGSLMRASSGQLTATPRPRGSQRCFVGLFAGKVTPVQSAQAASEALLEATEATRVRIDVLKSLIRKADALCAFRPSPSCTSRAHAG